jgi:hypothetical protein
MKNAITVLLALSLFTAAHAQPLSRKEHLQTLSQQGFRVAPKLPSRQLRPLRPQAEIVRRMVSLHALSLWVAAPTDKWSDAQVRDYFKSGNLLTARERAIMKLPRAQARERHLDSIGWRLENLWALAWIAGFDLKPDLRGQFEGAEVRRLVYDWLPGPSKSSQDKFLKGLKLRSNQQVAELEDLFYCAHNAVRSAQLGGKTVPANYDPVEEGGCIHERRHSLNWALSPGVEWEDTDLST